MKRIFGKLLIAIALVAAAPHIGYAQEYVNTPVTVSQDKVKINGEVCYSHVVLERQTLFSISKAYNVSVDEIYRLNPSLKESGLKKNSIILIPVVQEKQAEVSMTENTLKLNEERDERQKPMDSTIKSEEQKPSKQKNRQTVHIRKWFEDLNTIAEKYGVTPEAIMQANNLKSSRLSNRQKLVIPDAAEVSEPRYEHDNLKEAEEAVQVADSVITEVIDEHIWDVSFTPKETVKATMLLPLKTADGRVNRNNMDFYSGALLATYDLAEKGINIDFSMLDIADKTHPLTYEDLEGSDIVIGPVSGNDISKLLENFPSSSMIVSPLDPKVESLAADNRNLIQAPTPAKAQYVDMTEWVKEDMAEGDTVVVITEKAFKQSEAAKLMMEVIDSSGIAYNPFSYNILEGRDVVDTLKVLMARQGTSRVMIASESEAFVNDVVRNMNLMLYEQYKVVLYAPSKIRSFETIEVEHFHKTNMHVSLTYYIDYEDQRVKDFLLKYRALFNTEPSQFAFQGYDIASYFINLCNRYGDRWTEMVDNAPQAMLQSTFRCKKIDENGGYINNGIRRIIYDDGWSVYELK